MTDTKYEARLVGSDEELGDVSRGVEFYGAGLTRDWAPVEFSAGGLEKAKGNPHIELREHKPGAAKPAAKD